MKKEIKLIFFISFLVVIFGIFLYLAFKSYDYSEEYFVNEYQIIEAYDKKKKIYTFEIKNDNNTYAYMFQNKYFRKRELINNIQVFESDIENCILPTSDKITFYPLCSSNNLVYTYNLSNLDNPTLSYKKIDKIDEDFNKIGINKLNGESFMLYNYKGFYLINENKREEIQLFNKDIYSINLIYQKEEYLLIPDYNQDYYFNKIYMINIINGKIKEIEFDYDISFESEFLGDYKNNIYLIDKKEEKEYLINTKKLKVEEIEFQILEDNKMIKTSLKKVKAFEKINIYDYKIVDGSLYLIINDIKIKLSNNEVDKIIKNDGETVYYLSNENLYMYNNTYGEVLLINNFEWNFNNTNMIFLYK